MTARPVQQDRKSSMRMKRVAVLAASCMALAMFAGSFTPKAYAAGPIPVDCNRACLENLATAYLNALVAHDPSRLPLAKDVKYTENDQVMDVGDGFWSTATAVGHFRLCFSDLVMEQIGCMVTMHESDHFVIMAMRLRVQLGRITEIETTYYRQGGGGPSGIAALDASTPDPIWLKTVPASERVSRARMISTANMYFASLENDSGKGDYSFFADDCNRIENGMQTTNNPRLSPKAAFNAFALGCKAQFESGHAYLAAPLPSRRSGARRRVGQHGFRPERHGAQDQAHQRPDRHDARYFQSPVEHRGHRSLQDSGRTDSPNRDGWLRLAVSSKLAVGRHQ
jgi:hypothetical protein